MPASNRRPEPTALPHSNTAKALHWGFIVVFIYALTKQLDEVEELEDFALLHYEMVFATVFLLLLVARFIYMQTTRPSALPEHTPKNMRLIARFVHISMYVSLAMIAVTGIMIGGLYRAGVKSGDAMDIALFTHEIFVHLSFLLIVSHIAAAIFHRRKADGIWNSMVPIWKEDKQHNRE